MSRIIERVSGDGGSLQTHRQRTVKRGCTRHRRVERPWGQCTQKKDTVHRQERGVDMAKSKKSTLGGVR